MKKNNLFKKFMACTLAAACIVTAVPASGIYAAEATDAAGSTTNSTESTDYGNYTKRQWLGFSIAVVEGISDSTFLQDNDSYIPLYSYYTDVDTYNKLMEALYNAQKVYENESLSDEDYEAAYKAVNNAINEFVEKANCKIPSLEVLGHILNDAYNISKNVTAVNPDDKDAIDDVTPGTYYISTSYMEKLVEESGNANNVLNSENPSFEDIATACVRLMSAVNDFVDNYMFKDADKDTVLALIDAINNYYMNIPVGEDAAKADPTQTTYYKDESAKVILSEAVKKVTDNLDSGKYNYIQYYNYLCKVIRRVQTSLQIIDLDESDVVVADAFDFVIKIYEDNIIDGKYIAVKENEDDVIDYDKTWVSKEAYDKWIAAIQAAKAAYEEHSKSENYNFVKEYNALNKALVELRSSFNNNVADAATLKEVIDSAKSALNAVTVINTKDDLDEVEIGTKYANKVDADTLENSIKMAENVLANPDSFGEIDTEDLFAVTINSLKNATLRFANACEIRNVTDEEFDSLCITLQFFFAAILTDEEIDDVINQWYYVKKEDKDYVTTVYNRTVEAYKNATDINKKNEIYKVLWDASYDFLDKLIYHEVNYTELTDAYGDAMEIYNTSVTSEADIKDDTAYLVSKEDYDKLGAALDEIMALFEENSLSANDVKKYAAELSVTVNEYKAAAKSVVNGKVVETPSEDAENTPSVPETGDAPFMYLYALLAMAALLAGAGVVVVSKKRISK